jgi:hypothetical protein
MQAKDLFKVFDAFRPHGGVIHSVTKYTSEFGRERLDREAVEGPPAEIFKKSKGAREGEEEDDEDLKRPLLASEKAEDFDEERLRTYQLERLR